MEAHRNQVRKWICNRPLRLELQDITRELWDISFLQLSLLMRSHSMEKRVEIENQLEELRARLSITSTELSIQGYMNDSDAGIIDRESSDGSLDHLKRLYADVYAKLDEITVEHWQMLLDDPSCEELVDKVWYAVVVSTVALLSIVYQYLLGYVLKGGTKAYSSGSLDFRDTFVSLLLFQGSYVWIFFRDVAAKRTVYRRSKKDGTGRVLYYYGKFEPRFKPHRERQSAGTVLEFNNLPLGGYDSHRDAEIVCQIAGYYYKRDESDIKLRDGSIFTIPPMPEQEQSLFGEDKVRCVVARAKEVFGNFQVKNNAIILPSESNAVGVHDYFQHVVPEGFSFDPLWDAADAHPVDDLCAVGEGLEGTVTPPSSADLSFFDSLIANGEGSEGTPPSPSTAEQVVRSMEYPQSLNIETSDVDSISELDIITQQLKEHFEAEISRRIAEQHEQHLQREKKLEECISELERNSNLQSEDEYVRSFLC